MIMRRLLSLIDKPMGVLRLCYWIRPLWFKYRGCCACRLCEYVRSQNLDFVVFYKHATLVESDGKSFSKTRRQEVVRFTLSRMSYDRALSRLAELNQTTKDILRLRPRYCFDSNDLFSTDKDRITEIAA